MARTSLAVNPFVAPSTSLQNRLGRLVWALAYHLLVRPSPRPFHGWRAMVLRGFGAQLGPDCHIYGGARIWAPWNLQCEDAVGIADGAVIYNVAPVRLRSHAVVSQEAFVCTATHDLDDPMWPMVSAPITIGARAWICARAVVMPGVTVGDGAVLGVNSVATRDLSAWTVHGGLPARALKARPRHHGP